MIPKAIEKTDNTTVRLIDQTQLPEKLVYLEIDDYPAMIEAIKKLSVRGAPAIGIAAAYGLALAVAKSGRSDKEFVAKVAAELKASRPTAVNLFWAVDRMLARYNLAIDQPVESALPALWSEVEAIHEEDRKMCEAIGKHGAELFSDDDSILTHCNTGALATGGIGTALGVIYTCYRQGKKLRVYADETRPLLQGSRLTAWELMQAGIDAILICDNMAGMLMQQGKIDKVIVGADRIAANGDFANKIGTYSVAVLAEAHNIPFYVAAPFSTFDSNIKNGDEIEIELRAADEVTRGFGKLTAPEEIEVYNPAFDVTPNRLVSRFITDSGLRPGGRAD